MKGTIVYEVPVRKQHSLKRFLDDFMLTDAKHLKVEYAEGEYSNAYSAYESMRGAIKRHKYPIRVNIRNGEVYLTRTDM